MKAELAERKLHTVNICLYNFRQKAIEDEIYRLESKLKNMDSTISEFLIIERDLGIMYNRLMNIWKIKFRTNERNGK